MPPNKKDSAIWKFFKNEVKTYLLAEYSYSYKGDGEVLQTFRGINRIDDYWLLEEFIRFVEGDGDNYDRISSFLPALALCKINETNFGTSTIYEYNDNDAPILKRRDNTPREISLIGGYNRQINNQRPSTKVRSLI
jgi:hypothetical protein